MLARLRTMNILTKKTIQMKNNAALASCAVKLPVVVIDKDLSNRMASTIRHNRARGCHSIEMMTSIVAELVKSGKSDAWILKNIGMDAEELLRLKQLSGIAELFKDKDFGHAWE